MENLNENLSKISYLIKYDRSKTINENLESRELDEQPQAILKAAKDSKGAVRVAKELEIAFGDAFRAGLDLKSGLKIRSAEEFVNAIGSVLKGKELGSAIQKLLNTNKISASLEMSLIKDIAKSKSSSMIGKDSAEIVKRLQRSGYSKEIAEDIAKEIKLIEKAGGTVSKTTKRVPKPPKPIVPAERTKVRNFIRTNRGWNWRSISRWALTAGITAAALYYILKEDETIPLPDDMPIEPPVDPTPTVTYTQAPEYCVGSDIKKGMKGDSVGTLQEYLNSQNRGEWQKLVVDKKFGMRTEEVVKEWQKNYGLSMTGVWGTKECEMAKKPKETKPEEPKPIETGGIPTTGLDEMFRRKIRKALLEQAVSATPKKGNYALKDVMEFCLDNTQKTKASIMRGLTSPGYPNSEGLTYKSPNPKYDQNQRFNHIIDGELQIYTLLAGERSFKITKNLNCPNIATIETTAGAEAASKLGADASRPGDLGQLEDLYNQLKAYIRQGYRGQTFEMAARYFGSSSNPTVKQYGKDLMANKDAYWKSQSDEWKQTYNNYNRGIEDNYNQMKNPPEGTGEYYNPRTVNLSALGIKQPQTIYMFKMGGESATVSGGQQTRISPKAQSLGRCFGDLFLLYHYATTSEPSDPIIPGTDMVKRTVLQCMREGNFEQRNIIKQLTDRKFESEVEASLSSSKYDTIKDNRGKSRYRLKDAPKYLSYVLSPDAGKYMANSPQPAKPKPTDNRF